MDKEIATYRLTFPMKSKSSRIQNSKLSDVRNLGWSFFEQEFIHNPSCDPLLTCPNDLFEALRQYGNEGYEMLSVTVVCDSLIDY